MKKPSTVAFSRKKPTRKKIWRMDKDVRVQRRNYLSKKVVDYSIDSKDSDLLFSAMSNSGGFESRNLYEGVDIMRTMIKDENCQSFYHL